MKKTSAIILAAGKGIRMRSPMPKALCALSGKPMVHFLLKAVKRTGVKCPVVIGGYKIELLKKALAEEQVKLIRQKRLLGSADAVKSASNYFKNFNGDILVLYSDTPLIRASTIKGMAKKHSSSKAVATILTVVTDDPKEYGRVIRDDNNICGIVEHADIKNSKLKTQNSKIEINVGAYCFNSKKLFEGLKRIKKNKKKGEFYLTDIIAYFYTQGYKINSYATTDIDEALGVNRRSDLIDAEKILRRRTIEHLVDIGVTIKDPASTYIDSGAKIGRDTVIYPFVVIEEGVLIGAKCKVGPFAHLRKGTVLKNNSAVGNFVEVVRSKIGKGSRAKHHTYLGDTIIGKDVNVGAGTITANYDGKAKNKTVIHDGAFIGSGTTIVAPVKIGKRAMTGAGSVVVKGKNVAPGSVVVGVPAKPLIKKKNK
ncbi:MAG: bifunctional N-acetylglucosamine-1-phosphate uridyltransferase/glucosamine-1-phosphate acetyltransferase [Candidatus Omnitrophica bacterium]|nr:bifunctional N-acetylglucosamine-1-phosphate uridyltransferase/glucosamine-1-phosphate acetyltransferase [Candidatus Omnitrophota bacterium]